MEGTENTEITAGTGKIRGSKMSDRVEQTDSRQIDEAEKIDLIKAVEDFLHGLKKLWLLILALIVLGAGVSYFRTTYTYTPQYVASATMAVTGPGGEYSGTATQMAEIFPYILSSGVLQDVVAREMGMDYVPGSVSAQAEEGTNLLTMSVTSNDPQMAYDVLHKMIECYPEVAEFVLGETSLEILDETGVPSDTRREIVVRGSYKRGAAQGALAGLVILCLYVFLKKTVRSKEKLKKYINLPDMGSLPYIKQKKRNKKNRQTSVSLLNDRTPGRLPGGRAAPGNPGEPGTGGETMQDHYGYQLDPRRGKDNRVRQSGGFPGQAWKAGGPGGLRSAESVGGRLLRHAPAGSGAGGGAGRKSPDKGCSEGEKSRKRAAAASSGGESVGNQRLPAGQRKNEGGDPGIVFYGRRSAFGYSAGSVAGRRGHDGKIRGFRRLCDPVRLY